VRANCSVEVVRPSHRVREPSSSIAETVDIDS
jgi:hypothetical protein